MGKGTLMAVGKRILTLEDGTRVVEYTAKGYLRCEEGPSGRYVEAKRVGKVIRIEYVIKGPRPKVTEVQFATPEQAEASMAKTVEYVRTKFPSH